jgi:hypothetical protein
VFQHTWVIFRLNTCTTLTSEYTLLSVNTGILLFTDRNYSCVDGYSLYCLKKGDNLDDLGIDGRIV